MTTHADDQPLHGFGASAAELPRPGRRSADVGGTLRPRRLPTPEWGAQPSPRDPQRYYLCSEEPSGEFVEVIIPVTDAGRRRYFATSDGERLTEVDEDYFMRRGEGNARSLLELDAREMAELEAELNFVRPVLGRDPLAEAAAARAAEAALARRVAAMPDAAGPTDAPAGSDAATTAEPAEPPAPEVPAGAGRVFDLVPNDDRDEDQDDDDDDDDDEINEENDVVMGTNMYEQVEPAASAMPANVTPMPVAPSGSRPSGPPPATAPAAAPAPATVPAPAGAPASAAPPAPVAAAPEASRGFDAGAQVSLAKGIAFMAHRGQLDRVGAEYIDHPGRVAERFDPLAEPVPAAAAWLHDVLEDTAVTAQNLLEAGVLPEIVEVVQLLTRTSDVADDVYYERINRHPVARRVKLADIADNTAPWRVRRLDRDTQVRLAEKYRHAREVLGA